MDTYLVSKPRGDKGIHFNIGRRHLFDKIKSNPDLCAYKIWRLFPQGWFCAQEDSIHGRCNSKSLSFEVNIREANQAVPLPRVLIYKCQSRILDEWRDHGTYPGGHHPFIYWCAKYLLCFLQGTEGSWGLLCSLSLVQRVTVIQKRNSRHNELLSAIQTFHLPCMDLPWGGFPSLQFMWECKGKPGFAEDNNGPPEMAVWSANSVTVPALQGRWWDIDNLLI